MVLLKVLAILLGKKKIFFQKVTKNIPKLKEGNMTLKCTGIYLEYLKPSSATKDRISKRRGKIGRNRCAVLIYEQIGVTSLGITALMKR